ncbi:MAG TPA: DUF4148 domain-containing protein [Trinickia sp.]|nr:DUF4148 domain-containing protein [Trinickia sp.]HTI16562.1 DUF4148 domain-containing protein [Trinickia sp.]
MKTLTALIIAASAISAPALSFAQSNGPLTRAEVRAELVRLEQAGYNPSQGSDSTYPADIQAAEAKVAAAAQDVGGVAQNGDASSGAPMQDADPPACVGPVTFCDVYSGD